MKQHPQSQEAEKGLLCAFMLDPIAVGRLCAELEIAPAHFYLPAHADIFETQQFLYDQNKEFDHRQVTQMLRDAKKLTEVGGLPYITELMTYIPTTGKARQDAETLREKKWGRDAIATAREIEQRAMNEQDAYPKLREDVQKSMLTLCATSRRRERHNAGQLARELVEEWERCEWEKMFGVSTGFPSLDAEIGGLCPGDLIIIKGQTSSGKSALAQQFALNFLRRGERVLDNTFEMTARQRVKRWLQMISGRNLRDTMNREPVFNDPNSAAFRRAMAEIETFRIEIMDDRGANIRQICANARNLHSEAPFGLLVTDYDELIKGERSKGGTKEEEIASISSLSKTLAGELNCPHILLSQENDDGKTRGSRSKQNDANILLEVASGADDKTKIVTIMKQRDGKRGEAITFDFDGSTTTFKERP